MRILEIAAIVACLVADIATPVCSGAFRLDPAQSIEAVRSRALTPRIDGLRPSASPPPGPAPARALWARPPGLSRAERPVRPSALRGLPRAALAAASPEHSGPPGPEDG
jgi:hypothetical protein